MPQTFTPFKASQQYYFKSFNLVNSQPYCKVNFSRSLIPLVIQVFWNTGLLPWATTPNILRQDGGWHIYSRYYCVTLGRDMILWFALLTTIDLAFSQKFVHCRFVQIINSLCFSCDNYETQTQNFLIPGWKPNRLCFPLEIKGLWIPVSSIPWLMHGLGSSSYA